MTFPKEYHAACRYLVRFGSSSGDARIGRLEIAAALRAIRSDDRSLARGFRKGMLFVAGRFPVNPNVAIRKHAVRQKNEVGR